VSVVGTGWVGSIRGPFVELRRPTELGAPVERRAEPGVLGGAPPELRLGVVAGADAGGAGGARAAASRSSSSIRSFLQRTASLSSATSGASGEMELSRSSRILMSMLSSSTSATSSAVRAPPLGAAVSAVTPPAPPAATAASSTGTPAAPAIDMVRLISFSGRPALASSIAAMSSACEGCSAGAAAAGAAAGARGAGEPLTALTPPERRPPLTTDDRPTVLPKPPGEPRPASARVIGLALPGVNDRPRPSTPRPPWSEPSLPFPRRDIVLPPRCRLGRMSTEMSWITSSVPVFVLPL